MTNQQFISTCAATARKFARDARFYDGIGKPATASLIRDLVRINMMKARAVKAGYFNRETV